jgi:hypothetical protein
MRMASAGGIDRTHMAHAVLEAYPDDEPVVSPDPGWRTL